MYHSIRPCDKSTVHEERYKTMCHVLCYCQQYKVSCNNTPFKTSTIPHLFVDAWKGCVAPADGVQEKNGSYLPPSRSAEFLAIKLLAPWRSLAYVYPYSSHSRVPSNFDGSPYQTVVLSTCPLHTNSGCGKERRILIGPW